MSAYGFIYVTTNLVNGKRYVGKRVYDARGAWKTYLGSGIGLCRAVKVYGKENFRKDIIEECQSVVELNEREKYWIAHYNATSDRNFYNIADGGDGGNVRAGYSEEEYTVSEAKRIAAVRAGIRRGEDAAPAKLTEDNVREIIARLLRNDFPSDIARDYGVSTGSISDIREHKTWRSLTDGISFDDVSGRKRPANIKPVYVYDKADGTFIGEYKSARDAGADLGVDFRQISQVCNGQKRSAHGYIFSFEHRAAS